MPRNAPLRISLAVAALAAAALFCPASAAPQARPIAVKSFTAPCEVMRAATPGRWYKARVGIDLKAGDSLRTGPGGRAVLLMSDGSKMTMSPSTRLRVEEVAPNRLFGLDVGRVKSYIKKLRQNEKFQIKTPLAAASVRGTVFEVGHDDGKNQGFLAVDEGSVALAKGDEEILVGAGERVGFSPDLPLAPAGQKSDAGGGADREEVRREVGLGMSKEEVMAAAAEEMRLAEYQEGKVLTDVFGKRVRLEEYIIRRPKEIAAGLQDRAFKLVVLNEREDRFDYMFYRGVFNTALPADLSVAFREMNGKLGAQPTYWLDSYTMAMSNTQDTLRDTASGGHLVQVTFDGTNYTLADPTDLLWTRDVALNVGTVVLDGQTYYQVYDPVGDKTSTVTEAQYLAGDYGTAVYDGAADAFRPIGVGDTYWRTSFNDYAHFLNDVQKQAWTASQNVLALDLDATFTYAGGLVVPITDAPDGEDLLHNRTRLFYGDDTFESYDAYIIDDEGKTAPVSAFFGLSTGVAFKDELLNWNYQQVVTATEFQGRKIDLVVEPKILIKSGLIK
jgi:hypothetical protein